MVQTITLAHFSDIHLSPISGLKPAYINAKRTLGYLNWRRRRRRIHVPEVANMLVADSRQLSVDHTAITGDLINLGLPAEYAAALNWLKSVGPPETVTVVPGNHDIYTRLHSDPGVLRWAAYMGSESHSMAFPFVRKFGRLALIGLNSAVETPPFKASGELGVKQIDIAGDLLRRLGQEGFIRVILIHHPPLPGSTEPRRALKDAVQFEHMLRRHGAELVLHGHDHAPRTEWVKTRFGMTPVIGAASSSAAVAHRLETEAQYNLFTFFISDDDVRVRQIVRGFSGPNTGIIKLSETYLLPKGAAA